MPKDFLAIALMELGLQGYQNHLLSMTCKTGLNLICTIDVLEAVATCRGVHGDAHAPPDKPCSPFRQQAGVAGESAGARPVSASQGAGAPWLLPSWSDWPQGDTPTPSH